MRLAYFDCFSGISGAMALSAAVHAGADLGEISEALSSLPNAGFELEREDVEVLGISAARVHVRSRTEGVIWTYASIRSMLDQAELPPQARRISLRAFRLLAEADARVHGREADLVTFHDAGEPDVLVSMVGTALALHQLHVDRIFASPIPTGLG
ncbi:MAG TPA: nickel insertion protein, partial [Actinomycetota bacterium]|nr:nickel insertion protein [Actinomycetota bacterium]